MIIFIDGFQNTGKSTLINKCKYKHNRFPFNQYLKKIEIDDIKGYQLGKDLGICFMSSFIKKNIILDRGPLSTAFYSLKENRYGIKTITTILHFLENIKEYKNCKFVWIKKINYENQPIRLHKDGFDYLDDDNDFHKEEHLNTVLKMARYTGLKIHIFENDFSLPLKENYRRFNKFIRRLINEHD